MTTYRTLFAYLLIVMLGLAGCGEDPGDDDDTAADDDDTAADDDDTAADDDDSATGDDDDSATGDDDDSATGDDDDSATGDDDDSAAGDDDDSATGDDDDSATGDDDDTSGPNPCASQILVGSGLELDLSFEDGSGSTAADGSGNSRHATLHGSPTWANGYCGGGLSFDGTDDWAVVAGVLGQHTRASVTLEAWVYVPTAAPWSTGSPQILGGGYINAAFDTGSTNNYRLYLNNNGTGRFAGRVETGSPGATIGAIESAYYGPNPFPAAQWTHLALTYGPEFVTHGDHIVRLFVNAVEQANNAVTDPTGTLLDASDLGIAGWNEIGNAFFEGMVDDVRVWSELRGPVEICEDSRGTHNGSGCVY